LSDRPDETGKFTSDRTERALPSDPAAEMAVLVVEALLTAPADLDHLGRDPMLTLSQRRADRRLEPRVMGGLAEHMAEQAVAGLGDVPTPT
jgi:hypothetical protein